MSGTKPFLRYRPRSAYRVGVAGPIQTVVVCVLVTYGLIDVMRGSGSGPLWLCAIIAALALRGTVADLLGGIFIRHTKLLRCGDNVHIEDVCGRVLRVGLLHTVVGFGPDAPQNIPGMAVPNRVVFELPITIRHDELR